MPIKKIKRVTRRFLQKITTKPFIRFDPNAGAWKVFFTQRIKGRRLMIKKHESHGGAAWEKLARRRVLNSIDKLQGRNYVVSVAHRYPAKSKRVEHYHALPTLNELREAAYSKKATIEAKKVLAKTKLSPIDFAEKCTKSYIELLEKLSEITRVEIHNTNLLVDIRKDGKISFVLIDFG